MNQVLGARGATGYVLGRGAGSAAQWWMAAGVTPIAAYAPKGAASLAASYVNLANPGTYDAAPGVAPTFDTATGWTFNGTTQYLATGTVPANGWSVIARFKSSNPSLNKYLLGCRKSATEDRFYIIPDGGASGVLWGYGAAAYRGAVVSAGVLAMTGDDVFINSLSANYNGTIMSAPIYDIWIGNANQDGAPTANYFAGTIQSIWIGNTTLSAAQVATQSAAMP